MSRWLKAIFILVLIFSIYHLVRDVLQIYNYDSAFTEIAHRPHSWCKNSCDYVTLPLDILGIFVSLYVLKRNRTGKLGWTLLLVLALSLYTAHLLP